MKKEVLIAIIAGFSLGLIITFGIHTAQKSVKNRTTNAVDTKDNTGTTPNQSHIIEVVSPRPNSVIDKDVVSVSGSTSPGSLLAIIATAGTSAVTADDNGQFSTKVDLDAGPNTLIIKSYSPIGQEAEITIDVAHSTADLLDEEDATQSAKEQ